MIVDSEDEREPPVGEVGSLWTQEMSWDSFSPRSSTKDATLPHFDFSPIKPILDF